jgi:hypothetical protein
MVCGIIIGVFCLIVLIAGLAIGLSNKAADESGEDSYLSSK